MSQSTIKRQWPKCRNCGKDLLLSHVELFFCNADCEAQYHHKMNDDQLSPEEQSLREAIGLGIGGRGVAEY